jgi:hypothetical protein
MFNGHEFHVFFGDFDGFAQVFTIYVSPNAHFWCGPLLNLHGCFDFTLIEAHGSRFVHASTVERMQFLQIALDPQVLRFDEGSFRRLKVLLTTVDKA